MMAPELDRLPASADCASILEVVDRDGAVILENFLSEARGDGILAELAEYVDRTRPVGDDLLQRAS